MVVRYFADIRKLTGRDQETFGGAATTLRALLRELARQHGPGFAARVLEGDALSRTIIVLVNGRNAEHVGGLDAPLDPDATVAVFPMVAGG